MVTDVYRWLNAGRYRQTQGEKKKRRLRSKPKPPRDWRLLMVGEVSAEIRRFLKATFKKKSKKPVG
jgi:hypothetical protein